MNRKPPGTQKQVYSCRLPPFLLAFLRDRNGSKAIEEALIQHFQLDPRQEVTKC